MWLLDGDEKNKHAALRAILDAIEKYPNTDDWANVRDLVVIHMAAAYGCHVWFV